MKKVKLTLDTEMKFHAVEINHLDDEDYKEAERVVNTPEGIEELKEGLKDLIRDMVDGEVDF